jgi:hypothetical protein
MAKYCRNQVLNQGKIYEDTLRWDKVRELCRCRRFDLQGVEYRLGERGA